MQGSGMRNGGDGAGGPGVFCPVDADRCGRIPPSRKGSERSNSASAAGPSVAVGVASSRLAAIREAIGDLRDLKLWTIAEKDLLDLARDVESTLRAGFGVQVRLAGEMHERGVADVLDARSAAHLLHQTLNVTVGEARARVAAATAALPSETPTGAVVEPAMPELLSAVDAGEISAGHARVIARCVDKIPDAVDEATQRLCRDVLLEQARLRDENGLRQVAEQILDTVDPDGTLSGKDATERAELYLGGKRDDGLTPIRGLLSPLTAEQLRVAIEALSAPKPLDDATPDPRPAPLRREQALGEILHRYLTTGAGPRDGGVRPQVVVTIGIDDLTGATGGGARSGSEPADGWRLPDGWAPEGGWDDPGPRTPGATGTPGPRTPGATGTNAASPGTGATGGGARLGGYAWSDYAGVQQVALARLLACDAAIVPQVLGAGGAVLAQGRAVRLFTAEQRRAITTRDKGCAFPGCDIPPAWCEAHHIVWWSDGGTTDIDNGILLCRHHHVLVHHGEWRIEHDPDGGRPWFVPPGHIDPKRQPRRNTHFHLPDLLTTIRRQ